MKDTFLRNFYQKPSQELKGRVASELHGDTALKARGFHLQRVAAIFTLVLILAFAVTPGVRAGMANLIRTIAGITVNETIDYPNSRDAEIVPSQDLSVADAQNALGIPIALPVVPEGFVLAEQARFTDFGTGTEMVEFSWADTAIKENPSSLNLAVFAAVEGTEPSFLIGTDSGTEIEVNGQPTMLVRGGWFENSGQWEEAMGTALIWEKGGLYYQLTTQTKSAATAEQLLVQVAESIR